MELVKGNTHRIYAVIGKTTGGSESTPTFTGFSDMKTFWDDATGFKRITSSDISMVVPHGTGTAIAEWDVSQGFGQYDHTVDLFTSPSNPFVAYVDPDSDNSGDDIDVYKCLFNNSGGAVSAKPTTTTSSLIRNAASDGHFWKYMYTFADTSVFFTTDNNFKWLPVQTLTTKPSDDINLRQWNVQMDAVDGAIDVITHASNFDSYTIDANVTVTSNTGSGFVGKIARVGATTKRYVDTKSTGQSEGTGYRDATVTSPSNLTSVIGPIGGHGFDAEQELGAKDLMVTARITDNDIAVGSVASYAKVGLILDPIISTSSQDDILASSTSILSGTRASGSAYLTAGLLKYSGKLLYMDHRTQINRISDSNTDTLRIVLQF